MAVKAREKEEVYPVVAHAEARCRRDDGDRTIVERPRWFEDLARPPYKPRGNRVAEAKRR